MPRRRLFVPLASVVLPLLALTMLRTVYANEVDYQRDVKPILERCHACHGALQQQSSLRVDTAAFMLQGGDSGPAVVPGNAAESLLLQAVTGDGAVSPMPPEGEASKLSAAEIETLRAWIDQGAVAPADEPIPEDPRLHWAFHVPQRPPLPQAGSDSAKAWIRTPIDAFIQARHQQLGLGPSPSAPKHVLLRRVYLDLIGLPPTPEQVQAFLADDAPDAYERVVQRLLDSPQYGERWGRHWMDVWRYGDWAGFGSEIRESQYHLWRWRDWIVEALNSDRPYDQMIMEMLAGDEIAPTDPDVLRATGYLGRNWYKFNRNVWLDNTVEHCGKAFLGLTFNCARCHDHKYDPITQVEYFQLRAIFETHDVRYDVVPGQIDVTKDGVARVYDKQLDAPTYLFVRGNEAQPDKEHPLTPAVPALFGHSLQPVPIDLPVQSFYPALDGFLAEHARASKQDELAAARAKQEQAETDLASTRSALEKLISGAAQLQPAQLFIEDSFDEPRSDTWTLNGAQWSYRDGLLVQEEVSFAPPSIVSRHEHPQDFRLQMTFRTTGGQTYKSVGVSFDYTDPGNFQSVYLSAMQPGSKLQVYHAKDGKIEYPASGALAHPVPVGELQRLELAVRGQLLNVWVNGQFKLAYELPVPRRPGHLTLWAFDATAEFHNVKMLSLGDDEILSPAGSNIPPPPADPAERRAQLERSLAEGERSVQAAALGVSLAEAELDSYEKRLAADRAKYGLDGAEDKAALARAASQTEREAALVKAQLAELEARGQVTAAQQAASATADDSAKAKLTEAENKLAEATKAVEQARSQLAESSEQYSPVGEVYPQQSSGRRLALARWIASRQNPLTARVAINHIWMRHFGAPLVPTVFDMGLNGQPPTHPELLDWLAVELMENGWHMKPIHRLIVLSSTYRQNSSLPTTDLEPDPRAIDPDNHWLWRMNSRRMEAEVVRDSLLRVGGNLDLTMGGPEIDENKGQDIPRRSIYFRHAKEKEMIFTKVFDGPGVSECYERSESIVPQQSLALANSPLAKAQARLLARKLTDALPRDNSSATGETATFIEQAYWYVLQRAPSEQEIALCQEFVTQQTHLLADTSQLTPISVGQPAAVAPADAPQQRARENLIHVLLNHHDFVTIW